jgi:hypothetical protein
MAQNPSGAKRLDSPPLFDTTEQLAEKVSLAAVKKGP